jgi:hypothetical protein
MAYTPHRAPLSMLLVAIARVRDSQAVHYPNFRNAAVYGNGPPMERSACHGPGGQFTEAWALARLELNWIVQGIDRGEDFT